MVQFSDDLLDQLLAPGISRFDQAAVPAFDMNAFPQASHWLQNLFLNSVCGTRYTPKYHAAAVTFIVRSQTAMAAYIAAREATLECVDKFQSGSPNSRAYFRAVTHWEAVLLNTQIALDMLFTVILPTTPPEDETKRLRRAANRIKHFAEDVSSNEAGIGPIIPVWLAEDRLVTSTVHVTYDEIFEQMMELGRSCDFLSLPIST